jgi:hypothetical protein
VNLSEARAIALRHPDAQALAPWTLSTFGLENENAYAVLGGPRGWAEDLDDTQVPMDPLVFIVTKRTGGVVVAAGLGAEAVTGTMRRVGTWPGSRPVLAPILEA